MVHSTLKLVLLASAVEDLERELLARLHENNDAILQVVLRLLTQEVTPQSVFRFEEELAVAGRELLRLITEYTLNQLEPSDPDQMPKIIRWECGEYRRESHKTPNGGVSTRFGNITLWRFPYRFRQRESEPAIFPLELLLGLVRGATPALADAAARYMADTGASQGRVLERLKREHDVGWGAERLRAVTSEQAESMSSFRHQFQVARVLEWLQTAYDSRGKCKPVLAVGRDGISVCRQPQGYWEVASVATVTVYDRSGKRVGTIYLAQMPESCQVELTKQLKQLICDILRGWQHPLPRLCYVTDAGENETQFYRTVLRHLRDPHSPRRRLTWYRIVDYYHVAEYITTMADCLFGKNSASGQAWARRMRKLLLKPNGPSRVLHSAAAMVAKRRRKMGQTKQREFNKASNYIRTRTRFMDYHGFRQLRLPIGSGVTEAACKTVFTQRLKLSGMRWKESGGQAILDLRVLLLSGVWEAVRDAMLASRKPLITVPPQQYIAENHQIAA